MIGKVRIGATVTGPSGSWSMRVMHISRGLPLISAEHEPHLPALQFQRQARSGASVAWIRWMTSRTTSPSWAGRDSATPLGVAPPDRIVTVAAEVSVRPGHRRLIAGWTSATAP